MAGLSFVTLLSYDYRYAFAAIGSYYPIADEIVLGVDAERITWSGKPFEFDVDLVKREVGKIDVRKKVRFVEGNFHAADDPMANDTAERSALSLQCKPGHWMVQIDSDEIVLNGPAFRQWLLTRAPSHNFQARWHTVFKSFGDKVLVVEPANEWTPVATQLRGGYTRARFTGQPVGQSPLELLHFSWGRRPEEVRQKLANWSHARDFDGEKFFAFWQGLTLENYRQVRNFHPINPTFWRGLKMIDFQNNPF